jgi:hypothetical protein
LKLFTRVNCSAIQTITNFTQYTLTNRWVHWENGSSLAWESEHRKLRETSLAKLKKTMRQHFALKVTPFPGPCSQISINCRIRLNHHSKKKNKKKLKFGINSYSILFVSSNVITIRHKRYCISLISLAQNLCSTEQAGNSRSFLGLLE